MKCGQNSTLPSLNARWLLGDAVGSVLFVVCCVKNVETQKAGTVNDIVETISAPRLLCFREKHN